LDRHGAALLDRHSHPFIADGAQDAAVLVALTEHKQAQRAVILSDRIETPWVPAPVFGYDASVDAAIFASQEPLRRPAQRTTTTDTTAPVYVPEDHFPVLVSQMVILPYGKTDEGQLIRAVTLPLLAIIRMIYRDPSRMYEIDPRKWEEINAAAYEASGLFDEVILTPRSGDRGRDVIAVKRGFWSVRVIESVKRYKPGHVVAAEEVQALLGVLHSDPQASKGIVSTTWEFAPKIGENPQITQYIPHRLELVNGTDLVKRLKEATAMKSK
jgi:restriction system protein